MKKVLQYLVTPSQYMLLRELVINELARNLHIMDKKTKLRKKFQNINYSVWPMANIRNNNCTFCILFFSYWHLTLCFLLLVNSLTNGKYKKHKLHLLYPILKLLAFDVMLDFLCWLMQCVLPPLPLPSPSPKGNGGGFGGEPI